MTRTVRALSTVALLGLTLLLVLGGLALALPASGRGSVAAPVIVRSAAPVAASLGAVSAPAAHASPQMNAGPGLANGCQPTPGGTPNWNNDPAFFNDALVTVTVPGDAGISGSNFALPPCDNVLPTYTDGFWVNVTTNVLLTSAYIKIWGSTWPSALNPTPDIPGFSPSSPAEIPMVLNSNTGDKIASFYFNDYRFFWPGDQVYFNLTLVSDVATPSIIYSAGESAYSHPIQWTGGYNNATWEFYVASPFSASPLINGATANFSQVISVSTSPDVLDTPAYEPNPTQPIQIYLNGVNTTGSPFVIPRAQLYFTLSGGEVGDYSDLFTPYNHSHMQLSIPLGPYPATRVQFNVTAWLPWQGGAIDRIYSQVWAFNWTNAGGWWDPQGGLLSNCILSSSPDVTGTTETTDLSTGTPVNISILEPTQNVTIGSAAVHFLYWDANGSVNGTLPMQEATANSSYALLPGLPPNSNVQLSVEAKDINGNPISSGLYTYRESGPLNNSLAPGYGLFFFEAIDLGTGSLVPNLNFTISNGTWHETRIGTPLGFAAPVTVGGRSELPVSYGTYVVTVNAFGQTRSWTGTLGSAAPFVVLFFVASGPVAPTYAAPVPGLSIAAAIGLVATVPLAVFMYYWFDERRKKIEKEQRRISL